MYVVYQVGYKTARLTQVFGSIEAAFRSAAKMLEDDGDEAIVASPQGNLIPIEFPKENIPSELTTKYRLLRAQNLILALDTQTLILIPQADWWLPEPYDVANFHLSEYAHSLKEIILGKNPFHYANNAVEIRLDPDDHEDTLILQFETQSSNNDCEDYDYEDDYSYDCDDSNDDLRFAFNKEIFYWFLEIMEFIVKDTENEKLQQIVKQARIAADFYYGNKNSIDKLPTLIINGKKHFLLTITNDYTISGFFVPVDSGFGFQEASKALSKGELYEYLKSIGGIPLRDLPRFTIDDDGAGYRLSSIDEGGNEND